MQSDGRTTGGMSSLFSLGGKTAIVSGVAESGIGFAIAQALAESGANVAIIYNGNESAIKAAKKIQLATGVQCKWVIRDTANLLTH